MRSQENEPDKNEPDNEEVVCQTVTEDIEKGPAEKQNSKTEQKDPDVTLHTVTFLSPDWYRVYYHKLSANSIRETGLKPLHRPSDLDFDMHI
jgi:hypothetical protein